MTEKLPPTAHPSCGTTSGYTLHHRRGETPCDPCREARRQYTRDRRLNDPATGARARQASRESAQRRRASAEGREAANARSRRYGQQPEVREKKSALHAAWRTRAGNVEKVRQSDAKTRERWAARSGDEVLAAQVRLRPDGLKRCGACCNTKPLSDFYQHASTADGLSQFCSACVVARVRASKLRSTKLLQAHWEAQGIDPTVCVYRLDAPATELEHVMPRALGGADDFFNYAPACQPCNRTKHDTHPLDWLKRAFPSRLDFIVEHFPHIKETA